MKPHVLASWPRPARFAADVIVIGASVADLLLSVTRGPWALAVSCLAVGALTLRRRYPLPTLLLGLPNVVWGYALVAQLVATFTLAHRAKDRRLVGGVIAVVAIAQVVGMFLLPGENAPTDYDAQGIIFAGLIVGGPASLGLLLRAYEQLAYQFDELAARRERENALVARTVLAQERARLAREMHDVVSHQVSLIAVQAGALRMTTADPTVREMAGTLRTLAAKTLSELREMVNVLRDTGNPDSEIAPQPRLADLPRLVRDSGTGARLCTESVLDHDWPEQTERAAYRTVQEALTNVRKHAAGAPVTVELANEGDTIRVRVRNDRPPGTTLPARAEGLPGGGHGLVGLRERAELLGGTLTHGATGDGGFELLATLPGRAAGLPPSPRRTEFPAKGTADGGTAWVAAHGHRAR